MNHKSYYVMDEHHEVTAVDWDKWVTWIGHAYETEQGFRNLRSVGYAVVEGSRISTVFLGIDHSYLGGPPVLFETMVFGGELDQEQERYCTWDEAFAGHDVMVARVTAVRS